MNDQLDSDFLRLLKGDIKLADLTPEKQREFAVFINNERLGFESIKNPAVRQMIEKWNAMFP